MIERSHRQRDTTERVAGIRGLLASLCLAIAILFSAAAQAADFPSAFVVADVPVEATAQSPAAARDAAREDGERRAFRQLLERLTAKADWGRLPQANEDVLGQVVQDFEVASERASGTHYVGKYTFRFRPQPVRRLLQSAGIPFTELASKPVVVVPVLKAAGTTRLWDDPNPWRDAWNAASHGSGLVPYQLPTGDLADMRSFDAPNTDAPRPEQLAALSERYNGSDPVIAVATETTAGADTVLDITVTRYGLVGTEVATARVQAPKSTGEPYAAAVTATLRELEENWKKATISHGGDGTLIVSVPVASLGDWIGVRDRLVRTVTVKGQDVLFISKDEVRLQLRFAGDPSQLRVAFAQQDLVLSPGDPLWTLRRRQGSAKSTEATVSPPDAGKPAE